LDEEKFDLVELESLKRLVTSEQPSDNLPVDARSLKMRPDPRQRVR
jgi:hypothetical protein